MHYEWQVHIVLASCLFVLGAVVGSFLNVCIYRMPLQKSILWPDSRCPNCFGRIRAIENVPIFSWLVLRAACHECRLKISARYPTIEAITGLLFVVVYFADAYFGMAHPHPDVAVYAGVLYHCVFVAVLLAVSMIDYDWTIVPLGLTNFGLLFGIMCGTLNPAMRPAPAFSTTALGGLGVGLLGAAVGAGMVWVVRIIGALVFRREAMGRGDVDILAVIGAFMGWQAAVLSFFLSAFFGLIPSLVKLVPYLLKRLQGREWNPSDREIPLGPFLSMGAVFLLLTWHWSWRVLFSQYFGLFTMLFSPLPD